MKAASSFSHHRHQKGLTQKLLITVFSAGIVLLTASCNKENETAPVYQKSTIQYKAITGVDPNLLSLDVYHFGETGAKRPVVMYVHGGAFALGDKANSMENKTRLFSSLGYLLVSVNYRLSPSTAGAGPDRVKFPDHNQDVADAVTWLKTNGVSFGGDTSRIALLGHSAGAHLVALTGVSPQFLPARGIPLHAVAGVACIDTEGFDVVKQGREGNEIYLNAFGISETVWIQASPVHQIQTGTVYPKFFVAKRGTASRVAIADGFIAALSGAGADVTHITASQYDHEGINDAIGAPGETAVTVPLTNFLKRCFAR